MKKIFSVTAVLLLVIIFAVSFQYKSNKVKNDLSAASQGVTHSQTQESTSTPLNKNTLLVETSDKEYQVYFDGKTQTVVHGEHKYKIENLDWYVKIEPPSVYSVDIDNDGKKELLLREMYTSIKTHDDNWENLYAVMLFKPVTRADGKKEFDVVIANEDTWKNIFDSSINCEMTQLKKCKKILQLSMDDADEKISYDEKTGISKGKYVGYARALSNANNKYYTLKRWDKGAGIYNIDKNGNISLDIQVLVTFEETTSVQNIGNIHCDIDLIKGKLSIVPRTIAFIPSPYYPVNDPRRTAKEKWSCTINNTSKEAGFTNTEIDWIENEFSLNSLSGQIERQFGSMPSKIKCVESIKFTQNGITITAKPGFKFSSHMVETGKFSVIQNPDEKNEVDIAYTAVIKELDGKSTLVIVFDKTYDRSDLSKISVRFGV